MNITIIATIAAGFGFILATVLACRRRYTITPDSLAENHVEVYAFSKDGAKRIAKRMMRQRGWDGFRLRRF